VEAIRRAWGALRGYDREDVEPWLAVAVPLSLASQRMAVALTDAFIARSLERQPLGLDTAALIGAAVRNGTAPEDQWRRPFVTVWTALAGGTPYEQAVSQGLDRATSAAATDTQLAMRETLRAVGETDERIVGYERVPNGAACTFCEEIAGQRYRTDQLMPVHPNCGCSVDVITAANRGDFTGKAENDLSIPGVAIREHGELGPLVLDPAHTFTAL